MPHQGTYRFYDENFNPLKVDIYNYKTWERYGWSIYGDENLFDNYSEAEAGRFEAYLEVALKRAKQFHRALNINLTKRNSVKFTLIGSECKPTLDSYVIYKNTKKNKWITLTEPDSFRNSNGKKVSRKALEKIMFSPGDGRVTKRSLLGEVSTKNKRGNRLFGNGNSKAKTIFVCEIHDSLTGNPTIQKNVLNDLMSETSK